MSVRLRIMTTVGTIGLAPVGTKSMLCVCLCLLFGPTAGKGLMCTLLAGLHRCRTCCWSPSQVHHDEGSPLLLCDTCPRSFHLACVRDAHWGKLPVGDWSCPKCVERHALAVQRLAELETQKRDALERCITFQRHTDRPWKFCWSGLAPGLPSTFGLTLPQCSMILHSETQTGY